MSEYLAWLKKEHDLEVSPRIRAHYDAVTSRLERNFAASGFWTDLNSQLKEIHEEYVVSTGFPLLRSLSTPTLTIKPFDSFLQKTFRKNVLENPNWPSPPPGNWLVHPNWFSHVNDTIRTRFEVKYLDGVTFLAERLIRLGTASGFDMKLALEARPEGYYAAHIEASQQFEIPKLTWDTERRAISIELQITTQLQEVILQLTHKFYEERRQRQGHRSIDWQWDFRSTEFVGNYLSHILHYVEGMIMEVRERQREGEK